MADDALSCTAEGSNEVVDRVVVLTRIHVHYTLRLPPGAPSDKVSRALETHVGKCPTAQSIKESVEITWTADVIEADEVDGDTVPSD